MLAEPVNSQIQAALEAMGMANEQHYGIWFIGAKSFEWPSGKSWSYTAWGTGQPSNPSEGNCTSLSKINNMKWNDTDCDDVTCEHCDPVKAICQWQPKKCTGDDSCCTDSEKCGVGEGDCDYDSDCHGSLKCGHNNCPQVVTFGSGDDCCYYEYAGNL